MKVLVAIDSFKGSLSSADAGKAIKEGIKKAYPHAEVEISPLADGGEGTVSAIVAARGGDLHTVSVTGPLGVPVEATYGVVGGSRLAIMEMSAAAGITLVPEDKRDPMVTTTYGVGEMILHAIRENDCRSFILGIGGSATNDGGVGMLQALGFEFLDSEGTPVPFGARGLGDIARIRTDNAAKELRECTFTVACDVTNPLCGERGCSAVYGPQKGATPETIELMDVWMRNYAKLTAEAIGRDTSDTAGAGAAGGLGFALLSYLGGILRSGVDIVIEASSLDEKIKRADVVVTGEGRLDGQSVMGKAPIGVAKIAKSHHKPVIAFSGAVTPDAGKCNEHGIDAFFPIVRRPCSLEEAMNEDNAYVNLRDTAEQAFRLIRKVRDKRL